MPSRNLWAAWVFAGVLLVGLALFSQYAPPRPGPSLDVLIRAAVAPAHERLPLS
jgi:hypothetical protein